MRITLLFALLLACRSSDGRTVGPSDGMLEVSWRDSAGAAHLVAPAEARWCARDTMLEVLAVRNDSAVGFALFTRDSLRAEAYPLFQTALFGPWRPQATAAVRLLRPTALLGYESTWGRVIVTDAAPGRISGTLDLHLKLSTGTDSLHVTGSFSGLSVLPAAASCGRADKPQSR